MIHKHTLGSLMAIFAILLPMTASAATFMSDANVLVTEPVMDNLYIASANPIVSADVIGDLFVTGGNVSVSGHVMGDLGAAGGSVTLTGPVDGDVRVFGGSIYIDSVVSGEIISFGGQVVYGPHARVGKDLVAGSDELKIDPAVTVGGKKSIFQGDPERIERMVQEVKTYPLLTGAFWLALLFAILGYLVVAIALMGAMPNIVKKYVQNSLKDNGAFWVHLGIGLLALIAFPVAAMILFITGIGAMLGLLLLLLWAIYVLVALVFSGFLLGGVAKHVFTNSKSALDWTWALGGVVILPILSSIPWIGWVIGLVFFLWALGTAVAGDFRTFKAVK